MAAARERLPDRRNSETFELEVAGLRYTCSVSFHDWRIAEPFLNNHKSNSAADTNARDSAITISIAVRHGADPETAAMSAHIIQFPTRNAAAVFVREVPGDGWLVLARDHAWTHGHRHAAVQDAQWLSDNLSLPIRVS